MKYTNVLGKERYDKTLKSFLDSLSRNEIERLDNLFVKMED